MTWKDCLLVAVFGGAMLLTSGASPCDCAWFAYEALTRVGVKLKTIPSIIGTMGPSSYRKGTVSIRIPEPCMVYVHEFVHHDQWLRGLEALHMGDAMWYGLEIQAKRITADAMEHQSSCE